MLNRSGYDVDVALESVDYPATRELLDGSPWIRHFVDLSFLPGAYDLACVSHWSRVDESRIPAHRIDRVPAQQWRAYGDPFAMSWHAARLNFWEPIPEPFCMTSGRRFVTDGPTLAIHPGCKPGWSWKRYPWFPAVAAAFSNVVLVGTADDWQAGDQWTANVTDFRGQLSLADTAALLSQCTALVANDSGLSHVAAALGIPVVAIYGATRPSRESMPLRNVYPLEHRLGCRDVCAKMRAGSCADMPGVPQCLRTLDPRVVVQRIREVVPALDPARV